MFICEFCLKYFYSSSEFCSHRADALDSCCRIRGPPGAEVYRDEILENIVQTDPETKEPISEKDPRFYDSVSITLVDGKKDKVYC